MRLNEVGKKFGIVINMNIVGSEFMRKSVGGLVFCFYLIVWDNIIFVFIG